MTQLIYHRHLDYGRGRSSVSRRVGMLYPGGNEVHKRVLSGHNLPPGHHSSPWRGECGEHQESRTTMPHPRCHGGVVMDFVLHGNRGFHIIFPVYYTLSMASILYFPYIILFSSLYILFLSSSYLGTSLKILLRLLRYSYLLFSSLLFS